MAMRSAMGIDMCKGGGLRERWAAAGQTGALRRTKAMAMAMGDGGDGERQWWRRQVAMAAMAMAMGKARGAAINSDTHAAAIAMATHAASPRREPRQRAAPPA
eukprot:5163927-Alexandrium_andersonii.AAC.1